MATILVVDDRPLNREFLATLLGYVGHTVVEAGDGIDALVAIGDQPPDLVIADLVMPGMDGVELARRLRSDPQTTAIPVIFYTAVYRCREAEQLGASCGVAAVIAKPAEPQLILNTVATVLGARPEPQSARAQPGLPHPGVLATQPGGQLGALQLHLKQSLSQGVELLNQGGEGPAASLEKIFSTVQSLSLRMSAVIELALELPAFREGQRLIEVFSRATQDILNARLAVVGILDRKGSVTAMAAAGCGINGWRDDIDPQQGLIAQALATARPCSAYGLKGNPEHAGLPALHPAIESLLVVPLISGGRSFGWFHVADKLGGTPFSADDQQFAATLAALLAVSYDNLSLYQEVAEHASRLDSEIAARKAAEDALRSQGETPEAQNASH